MKYEVIGAVCRLYDREELPYPCCRLRWRGKEPFWNRVGKRFVPDLAARRSESYNVRVLGYDDERVFTFFWHKLPTEELAWWFTLTKQQEKYVSESFIYDGYTQQSAEQNDLGQTYHIRRVTERIVHGY